MALAVRAVKRRKRMAMNQTLILRRRSVEKRRPLLSARGTLVILRMMEERIKPEVSKIFAAN